jgi:histidinol-phosphate aminotransferase
MVFGASTTRRRFMGGLVAAMAHPGAQPAVSAQQPQRRPAPGSAGPPVLSAAEYEAMIKLAFNESPYGPSQAVMDAMTGAWKYAGRYFFPESGLVGAIAALHGVTADNVILGAGSAEVLKAADDAFLPAHRVVVGVEPTFEAVYRYASGSNARAVLVPLREDHGIDIQGIIRAVRQNARDVGLVYICNPNNPTGRVVPADDIRLLLDSIPEDVPVLIDEAYHHFVDSPAYESSVKYVLEGRKVIVTRTFSKIAALAGMRLGYGIASREMIVQMKSVAYDSSLNALVQYGGAAALKDTAQETKVRQLNREIRNRTMAGLKDLGYELIPSDANFFMVNIRRDVTPIGGEFRKRGILVGRKFPPMDEWLRVSVGTADDMQRFMSVFREVAAGRAG